MNDPYTSESQLSASVTIGSRYYLDPTLNSPSLLRLTGFDPKSGFVVNFVSPLILQNILPGVDFSIGNVPMEESQPVDYIKFEEAKKYFQENKAAIVQKYRGMFIAILENSVVDYDKDFSELAKRVYGKFGYQTIYMPFVGSEPTVIRVPSPRVVKHHADAIRKEL